MARASINDLLKETTEYGSFSKEEIEEVIIAQVTRFIFHVHFKYLTSELSLYLN